MINFFEKHQTYIQGMVILLLLFLINLKTTGFIEWSWIWVFVPIWGLPFIMLCAIMIPSVIILFLLTLSTILFGLGILLCSFGEFVIKKS